MKKIDLKKELRSLYQPSAKEVVAVVVPTMNFLMIDGMGDPNNSQAYAAAVEALYAVSYSLKFMVKKGDLAIDYGVMPLEGLWWADDMTQFTTEDKANWQWTMMMMQPAFITEEMAARTIAEVKKKKNPAAIDQIRFAPFAEGDCAQIMHIGPFSEEGPTVAKVHDFIDRNGYTLRGKHHEIYLSDIRRADPARWKTVIRQPLTA